MSDFLRQLRHATEVLDVLIETLNQPDQASLGITQTHLTVALTQIMCVGEGFREKCQEESVPEVKEALQDYRCRLERLRELMPSMHAKLLTERARLEAERAHLEAASAWAESSKSAT